jgi:hypothetical protein
VTLPDYLILGVQKSGTTSLARHMRAHPDVWTAEPELHFFDGRPDEPLSTYEALFPRKASGPVGEGTPAYIYLEHAMARIARDLPGVRGIVILREPVDRAYSHYWHNRAKGYEPLTTFEAALAAEPQRLVELEPLQGAVFAYVDRGRYVAQVERAFALLGRDNVHVVLQRDLAQRPRDVLRDLYSFIGVDATFVPDDLEQRYNERWAPRSRRLAVLESRVPRQAGGIIARFNRVPASYPPVDADTRARLRDLFTQANERLAVLTGLDVASWYSDPRQENAHGGS